MQHFSRGIILLTAALLAAPAFAGPPRNADLPAGKPMATRMLVGGNSQRPDRSPVRAVRQAPVASHPAALAELDGALRSTLVR